MLQRFLLLWLLLLSGVAYGWPSWVGGFDPFVATKTWDLLGPLIAVTMFAIGSLLPRDEVAAVGRRWPMVLAGTTIQYATMPLLAFGIGHACGLPPALLAGVIVVGCVPGAMASNVLTLAARGNTSYSISLTTSATLLSPVVVPFTLWLTLGTQHGIDPIAAAVNLAWTVVLPVVVGHLLSRSFEPIERVATWLGPIVANLAILWIIAVVVALNRERLAQTTGVVVGALLLVNLFGYVAGYLGGTALRLPEGMRRALTLEVGMQNAGVGTFLALELFKDAPEFAATAAIPTGIYTFGCMLTGTILAAIWSSRPPISEAEESSGTAESA